MNRPVLRDARGLVYQPAIGPRLRILLYFIFLAVAFLGATGVYMLAIDFLNWKNNQTLDTPFSLWMFLVHWLAGLVFLLPFVAFGLTHYFSARHRRNRQAVRLGLAVFAAGLVVCATGLLLLQMPGLPQLSTGSLSRTVIYWLHGLAPVAAIVLYVLHRRAGPDIQWKWGIGWAFAVGVFVVVMTSMHAHDPRQWYAKGSPEGEKYFEPAKSRTVDANFIKAEALMMDEYCLKCHQDVYNSHIHSAHRFSSFNNPAYLFSVRETRKAAGVRASRWCAGCHDLVPFFSGEFDDPNYDDVNNPTAKAGITCVACHAITNVNSRSGNGDYTIEEPLHYPFAYSDNALAQWLNNQVVKARPNFHKKTFLKPFHRDEAFCSTCHKVGIPQEVNRYKEFTRGQNHNDSYLLSGVSGIGVRSWYYPKMSETNCNGCHMPLMPSNDFGARDFDGTGVAKVHNHMFVSANTGLPALVKYKGYEDVIKAHTKFLQECMRIDLFGLKLSTLDTRSGAAFLVGMASGGGLEHTLAQPLLLDWMAQEGAGEKDKDRAQVTRPLLNDSPIRPKLPTVRPGNKYLVEAVIRTLTLGHHFTQGTTDSNEVWVEFTAKVGDRVIGHSGGMSGKDEGTVDEWSHFLNALVLDRHGNRIDRRNPQDIFTPLYNHQIPPGAAQVVHYLLDVPADVGKGPIDLEVRLRYRKFDHKYMEIVHGAGKVPPLPIVDLCSDKVSLPVEGGVPVPAQESPIKPAWQRWNDYGIGCFLEGGPDGKSGERGMAEWAFRKLLSLEPDAHSHGYLNLARVHLTYGGPERMDLAAEALKDSRQKCDPKAPWWTVTWFTGQVNSQNGNLDAAIKNYETLLDPERRDPKRKLDFTRDFLVINELGKTLFQRSKWEDGEAERDKYLKEAVKQFEKTLTLDAEDIDAHEFLRQCYARLGGDLPADPPAPAPKDDNEMYLLRLAQEFADTAAPAEKRIAAAHDMLPLLKQGPSEDVLLTIHRQVQGASARSGDVWLRLAAGPVLVEMDRQMLAKIPVAAREFAGQTLPHQQRLLASERLLRLLAHLAMALPATDVLNEFLVPATWPQPGGPVQGVLAAVAGRGDMAGPFPEPRMLKLQKVRDHVRPLFEQPEDAETGRAAARVLGQVHLLLHRIFRVDENAAGTAVRIYRSRHPAADRASQDIVIYPLSR
jgi:hypothetical protein